VRRVHQGQAIPFKASISYQNGVSEEINFLIVDPYRTFMPMVAQNALPMASAAQGDEHPLDAQGVAFTQGWHYYYAGTDADQCRYMQIPRYESPNTSLCPSGCGATAWSMLFGWIDNKAANDSGNDYWKGRWGLFRMNGHDAKAPKIWNISDWRFTAIKDMTWKIRNDIDTWCFVGDSPFEPWDFGNSGPTNPWDMDGVKDYVHGRSAIRIYTKYSVAGIGWDYIRVYAQNGIAYSDEGKHTPVVIGTGWLTHYPLAYGYRWRDRTFCIVPSKGWGCVTTTDRQFFVNQGWGSDHGEWVDSDIWFAGRAFPYAAWNDDVGLYANCCGDWYFDYNHNGDTDESLEHAWLSYRYPLVGDFDRDHILGDIATYDAAHHKWHFDYRHNGLETLTTSWGYDDGKPFALDRDCDGFVDDVGLYQESNHKWHYADHNKNFGQSISGPWGVDDAWPIAGDFDNDGCVDDVALYHIGPSGGGWMYDYNHDGDTDYTYWTWGQAGDIPVAGDFDYDGFIDDVALFRPSTRMWLYDYDHDGITNLVSGPWGYAGYLPVAGNFETK
jgi:hypothetical protein